VKLSLANAQRQRMLAGAMQLVFKVGTESPWYTKARAATQKYAKVSKAFRTEQGMTVEQPKDKLGLPHVHAFSGLTDALLEMVTDEHLRQQYKDRLKNFSLREVNAVVKICKVEDMYEPKHKRLLLFSPMFCFMKMGDIPIDINQMGVEHFYMLLVQKLQAVATEMEGQACSRRVDGVNKGRGLDGLDSECISISSDAMCFES